MSVKVVYVAFKVGVEHSVKYFKLDEPSEGWDSMTGYIELGKHLAKSISKEADFVSVRFVRK